MNVRPTGRRVCRLRPDRAARLVDLDLPREASGVFLGGEGLRHLTPKRIAVLHSVVAGTLLDPGHRQPLPHCRGSTLGADCSQGAVLKGMERVSSGSGRHNEKSP